MDCLPITVIVGTACPCSVAPGPRLRFVADRRVQEWRKVIRPSRRWYEESSDEEEDASDEEEDGESEEEGAKSPPQKRAKTVSAPKPSGTQSLFRHPIYGLLPSPDGTRLYVWNREERVW